MLLDRARSAGCEFVMLSMRGRIKRSTGCRVLAVAAVMMVGTASMEASAVGVPRGVRSSDEALPRAVPGLDASSAGAAVPEVSGTERRAGHVSIPRDGQDHVLLFVSRCGAACQRQTAALRDWFARGFELPQGVVYSTIWIPGRTEPQRGIPRWLRTWPIRVLRDSSDRAAAMAYGAGRLPMWVFVDRSGALVRRYSGFLGIENLAELLYQLGMIPRPGSEDS